MEFRYIYRGLGVGLLGGLLAFVFARIFAEPFIQDAIDYEAGRDAAQESLNAAASHGGHSHGAEAAEVFSRSVQRNVGIGVGMAIFGLAMGGLFVVAYLIVSRRYPGLRPRVLAALLAAAGFVSLYLIPFAKYPANPPAVGHEETIGERSVLYLAMIAISVISMVLAVLAARWLAGRVGGWNASLLGALVFLVLVGIAMGLLPALGHLGINKAEYGNVATETPQPLRAPDGTIVYPGFPADLLFRFRFYSVISQLVLWATLALGFGALAERLAASPARERPRPAAAEPGTMRSEAATTA
ncbi:putative cobalt transporter subunit (CbtA) [Frankia canadensis]|uniref:Putative cobalt transporter subunit (CbtA) n=1 Tax=Frankia canadensis TaxID=1836972 RepID=A0A2I2KKM2_9ACTN|nr:CbtA family protein [Frankia canadensis]SNQ46221.1 putative cobalt transporter subunit (CbtA) [Frankia canadensis]SOU53511.1 putative cobalt transporter subunit (CbtA) [Frankia canadensis]